MHNTWYAPGVATDLTSLAKGMQKRNAELLEAASELLGQPLPLSQAWEEQADQMKQFALDLVRRSRTQRQARQLYRQLTQSVSKGYFLSGGRLGQRLKRIMTGLEHMPYSAVLAQLDAMVQAIQLWLSAVRITLASAGTIAVLDPTQHDGSSGPSKPPRLEQPLIATPIAANAPNVLI